MNNKMETNWNSFILGESQLECESIEDAEMLLRVCTEHNVNCNYVHPADSKYERYWYVKDNSLEITEFSTENNYICDCCTVKDYIENHKYHAKERENKNMESKEFIELCKEKVANYFNDNVDRTDDVFITTDDVFIVWYCKTLQNHKALLSTPISDGMYYEITYNGDKHELYFDAYKKWKNIKFDV